MISVYEDNYGISDLSDANSYSFSTNNEDIWIVPSESFLVVNVKLKQADNGADFRYADGAGDVKAHDVALDYNAFNIFQEARLFVNDQEIERIDHVGMSTLLYHLRNYNDYGEYYKTQNNELIHNRADILKMFRTQQGNFEFLLPVEKIFPMFGQIRHAFRGAKLRITLTKSEDATCVLKVGGATPNGKAVIQKMIWKVPEVEPSLPMQAKLEQMLSRNGQYTVTWPAKNIYKLMPSKTSEIRVPLASTIHKPTNVFVAFQNLNRSTNQQQAFMFLDQMNVEKISCEVNSVKFPDKDLEVDFQATSKKTLEAYNRFLDSCKNNTSVIMKLSTFETELPIYHIDVSKHKPELYENSNFPQIVINAKFRAAPVNDYIMWVIIQNEREATLNMENKHMKLIR